MYVLKGNGGSVDSDLHAEGLCITSEPHCNGHCQVWVRQPARQQRGHSSATINPTFHFIIHQCPLGCRAKQSKRTFIECE